MLDNTTSSNASICVIGLGYVGLPLAIEFGKVYDTTGFDISESRIEQLRIQNDTTKEINDKDFSAATRLSFSSDPAEIRGCDVFVVTVPTPVDSDNRPDLSALESASALLGHAIQPGNIVIYESTVYPGATEEVCVPIIEATSNLKFNKDFFVGYSPERINPGDTNHRLAEITKITSGSTPKTLRFVDDLYKSIIPAGTFRVSSIRTAEASKVIENIQRDLNIALVNELALIFEKLGINTREVIEAAATKWNFIPFQPGLVGGHCISVDPYYLTHKAETLGYHPDIILEARRINDGMAVHVANRVIRLMIEKRIHVAGGRILVLGFSFKENCPDIRNTKIIDLVKTLESYNAKVDIHDPWVDQIAARNEYDVNLIDSLDPGVYDAVVIAVAHDCFKELEIKYINSLRKPKSIIFDIKNVLPAEAVDGCL